MKMEIMRYVNMPRRIESVCRCGRLTDIPRPSIILRGGILSRTLESMALINQ